MELGGFKHKVRVSAVKKGISEEERGRIPQSKGKKKNPTKEKTVKRNAIMGMNFSFF